MHALAAAGLLIAPSSRHAAEAFATAPIDAPCTVLGQRAALADGCIHRRLLQMELANAELEQRRAQAMADARVRESLRIAMDPRCEEETLFLLPPMYF